MVPEDRFKITSNEYMDLLIKRGGIYDPHGRMKRDDVRANCDIFIDSYEDLDLARVLSFEG